jgi:hypothetical protein
MLLKQRASSGVSQIYLRGAFESSAHSHRVSLAAVAITTVVLYDHGKGAHRDIDWEVNGAFSPVSTFDLEVRSR